MEHNASSDADGTSEVAVWASGQKGVCEIFCRKLSIDCGKLGRSGLLRRKIELLTFLRLILSPFTIVVGCNQLSTACGRRGPTRLGSGGSALKALRHPKIPIDQPLSADRYNMPWPS
jgi:hypothetical protein